MFPAGTYKFASVILLLIVSSASYPSLRDEMEAQQNPAVKEVDVEARFLINDIRDTWRALQDSQSFFVITTTYSEIFCPGGLCEDPRRYRKVMPIIFSQGAVFIPRKQATEDSPYMPIIWKGKNLFCDKRVHLPIPLGAEDSEGFVSFKSTLQNHVGHWDDFYGRPRENVQIEINFQTKQCLLKTSWNDSVEMCRVFNLKQLSDSILPRNRQFEYQSLGRYYREIIRLFSDENVESCRVE
tara:strand:+ start:260 stop:979 length:720 start_codon:yes stop_codon:yes gene_type:complete